MSGVATAEALPPHVKRDIWNGKIVANGMEVMSYFGESHDIKYFLSVIFM